MTRSPNKRTPSKNGFLFIVLLFACIIAYGLLFDDRQQTDPGTIPVEARQTIELIKQGGPFPYPKDGTVFNNFEQRLPVQRQGYYREYTVPTPGRKDRGTRRIVAGAGPGNDVRNSGEYYYTGDHYRTFQQIRQ